MKKLDETADKLLAKKKQAKSLPFPVVPLFIEHKVNGEVVTQRPIDGYINATAMCKKAEKNFSHYYNNQTTKDFLEELSAVNGIPLTSLIQVIKVGANKKEEITWVHPDVAINLGQRLSPKLAVQVSKWIREWIQGNVSGYMPPHVKRYIANRAKIPHTHFSMLNKVYLNLYAPMEDAGFVFTNTMMPDISTGRIFSEFLREQGINPENFPTYEHVFTNDRMPVWARMYPIKYLPMFREYFNQVWLPKKSISYFNKVAPQALPYLGRILPLSIPGQTQKNNRQNAA